MAKDEGRKCRIKTRDGTYMGHMEDGKFIMDDDIQNGISFLEITGHRPNYNPIPLSDIEADGLKLEFISEE
jgi:hypothetical protein